MEKFSDKKLRWYIKAHKILLKVSSEFFSWIISFVIFMIFPYLILNGNPMAYLFYLIAHLFYWRWWGVKWHGREMGPLNVELELTIQVLEDIQKERNEE